MATNSNWFYPTWDRFWDLLEDNGFPENGTTENVTDLRFDFRTTGYGDEK